MKMPISRRSLMLAAAVLPCAPAYRAAAEGTTAMEGLAALEASSGARIGVAALDTARGSTVMHRADERFPLCSTFKLLAATAILTRSATDRGLLDRRVTIAGENLVAYSPISSKRVGADMTVAEICAAALQYSDNTAANEMLRLLGGPSGVTAFARSIGDDTFRLDRWETSLNSAAPGDPRDTSTPRAMMTVLQGATLGELLKPDGRRQLIEWMKGCTTGLDRIRAATPEGWIVADKTGSGDNGTANDIAVVWPRGKDPKVLAIYVTAQTAGSRESLVAAVARTTLQALSA